MKCVIWTGANSRGYGVVTRKGKNVRVTRIIAAGLLGRPLRAAEKVLHSCDDPRCINPNHLFVGTQLDNIMDMMHKGRHAATLSPADVRYIRATPRYPGVLTDLGIRYGLSPKTINGVRSRSTYKWVK